MTQSFGVLKVLFVIIHVQLAKLTISLLQIKQKKKSNESGQSSKTQSLGSGLYYFKYKKIGHWMTEYKKGGKYSKDLFVGIGKSEEHQQE